MQNTFNKNPNNNQENPTIQGQYQPNQPNMQYEMNSLSYNTSSQNLNTPYNNTIPKQAIQPGQPNPYQNSPYMNIYQPTQEIPLTKFPGQTGGIFNQPQNNINYENIKNVGEIPHLLFTQPVDNTFLINSKSILIVPVILMCFSLIFILICVFVGEPMAYIMIFFASIPIIVSICK